MFICGNREGLMPVTGRRHNTDDIIATVLAVEPNRFIYRGRIAVFCIPVLKDERICIVAEQRPDCSEEEVSSLILYDNMVHISIESSADVDYERCLSLHQAILQKKH